MATSRVNTNNSTQSTMKSTASDQEGNSGTPVAVVVPVVLSMLLLIVVAAVIFVCTRSKTNKKKRPPSEQDKSDNREKRPLVPPLRQSVPEIRVDGESVAASSKNETRNLTKATPMLVITGDNNDNSNTRQHFGSESSSSASKIMQKANNGQICSSDSNVSTEVLKNRTKNAPLPDYVNERTVSTLKVEVRPDVHKSSSVPNFVAQTERQRSPNGMALPSYENEATVSALSIPPGHSAINKCSSTPDFTALKERGQQHRMRNAPECDYENEGVVKKLARSWQDLVSPNDASGKSSKTEKDTIVTKPRTKTNVFDTIKQPKQHESITLTEKDGAKPLTAKPVSQTHVHQIRELLSKSEGSEDSLVKHLYVNEIRLRYEDARSRRFKSRKGKKNSRKQGSLSFPKCSNSDEDIYSYVDGRELEHSLTNEELIDQYDYVVIPGRQQVFRTTSVPDNLNVDNEYLELIA